MFAETESNAPPSIVAIKNHTAELYRTRLNVVHDNATDFLAYLNLDGGFASLPTISANLIGIAPPLTNFKFINFVHEADTAIVSAELAILLETGGFRKIELRLNTVNGPVWFLTRITLFTQEASSHILVSATDISGLKLYEQALAKLANHDSLTGLANRTSLDASLTQAIYRSSATSDQFAIFLLDLDGFKKVNDTLGHPAGDKLLQITAKRLLGAVRDLDVVARLGGDEFVIIVNHIADNTVLPLLAQRILDAIKRPFEVDSKVLHLSTSIGCALFPDHGQTSDALLKNADVAMYRAKASGKDKVVFFDVKCVAPHTLDIESALHLAIEHGEFLLNYQPIMHTSGKLLGCESLIRWQKADGTFVPPPDFIPVAETSGLISLLGTWVIRTACMQMAKWGAAESTDGPYVSVNVSPLQFRDPNFESIVAMALAESKLAPSRLVLEITEGTLMQDPQMVQDMLGRLTRTGIRISIDDFGTGYSSLAYLKKFPLSTLKIDKSFVTGIVSDAQDRAIVTTIINLAKSLGLNTVAEGVETSAQLDFLQQNGCSSIQGWIFGKACPAELFAANYLNKGVQFA